MIGRGVPARTTSRFVGPSSSAVSAPIRVRAVLEREWLTVVALSWFAVALLIIGPGLFTQDSWLTFAAGREVVRQAVPHTDSLAVITHERHWVDQQWLAQVFYYG